MKVTMNVVHKQFVNKEGKVVPYFGYFVEVNGIEIRFAPYESDKKLASYLFGKVLKGEVTQDGAAEEGGAA